MTRTGCVSSCVLRAGDAAICGHNEVRCQGGSTWHSSSEHAALHHTDGKVTMHAQSCARTFFRAAPCGTNGQCCCGRESSPGSCAWQLSMSKCGSVKVELEAELLVTDVNNVGCAMTAVDAPLGRLLQSFQP